ncbi:MAG1140 family protein [Mycoplasma sp. 'Moose RK']|uniref:MAG1140 family protein n=1 Tax=Mycoplasma sp. 'Moose RK' TaxID=2780095 RepID=UPI0018C1F53F|nr:hypothetical protein [Mycoplasma sp. 'Moose RK']MBG0730938.1 hypothetical protein [Mycoplasma sp. 'Moose RK']
MISKIYRNSKVSIFASIFLISLMGISLYYFFNIKTYKTVNFILEIDENQKTFTKVNSDIYYLLSKDSFVQFQLENRTIRLELMKITNTKQNEFMLEFTRSLLLKPKTQIPATLFLENNGTFLDLFVK